MLLWKRYGNNKMAAILHLQQYSRRPNFFIKTLFIGLPERYVKEALDTGKSPHGIHVREPAGCSFTENFGRE